MRKCHSLWIVQMGREDIKRTVGPSWLLSLLQSPVLSARYLISLERRLLALSPRIMGRRWGGGGADSANAFCQHLWFLQYPARLLAVPQGWPYSSHHPPFPINGKWLGSRVLVCVCTCEQWGRGRGRKGSRWFSYLVEN